MNNLIRSQNYQLWRDNYMILVMLGIAAISVLNIVLTLMNYNSSDPLNGGTYTAFTISAYAILYLGTSLAFTSRICGWDFTDKTLNYEILAGHTRTSIFWSRTLLTFAWVFIACAIVTILPIGGVTLFTGWGPNLSIGGALMRFGLGLLITLRLTCFFIFLTFTFKNCYLTLFLGYLSFMVGTFSMLIELFVKDFKVTYQIAFNNYLIIMDLSNYKLGYVEGEDIVQFITTLEPDLLIGTIVCSVVMSIVYLLLGYTIFRKSDIH